jgi:hypothetical protein
VIEELLTAKGVRRTVTKNGRRSPLKTHARILEFKKGNQLAGDTLEAVKWIGNQGSHESDLTAGDILDGAELLEYALRLLYDKSDAAIARRVKAINKSKGLPRRRKP